MIVKPLIIKPCHNVKSGGGFSLVELFVTLAVLSILAAVAAPNFFHLVVSKEMDSAQRNIAVAINKAKNLARTQSTTASITMLSDGSGVALSSVVLTQNQIFPIKDATLQFLDTSGATMTPATFTFDALGKVTPASGKIEISSSRDTGTNSKIKIIEITNGFGHIKLDERNAT